MALATVGTESAPGLKPAPRPVLCGTAEAVPFHRVLRTFLLQLSTKRADSDAPFTSECREPKRPRPTGAHENTNCGPCSRALRFRFGPGAAPECDAVRYAHPDPFFQPTTCDRQVWRADGAPVAWRRDQVLSHGRGGPQQWQRRH